jgi:hypothetical protein
MRVFYVYITPSRLSPVRVRVRVSAGRAALFKQIIFSKMSVCFFPTSIIVQNYFTLDSSS